MGEVAPTRCERPRDRHDAITAQTAELGSGEALGAAHAAPSTTGWCGAFHASHMTAVVTGGSSRDANDGGRATHLYLWDAR